MLRVGLVGCGTIGKVHARGWLAIPEKAQIVAVADADEESAQELATFVGAGHVYSDFRDLLQSNDIDAVDICLPHHLHTSAIIEAAKNGKHVLCEKPLCVDSSESDDIIEAVSRAGVTMMCAHNQLFDPAVRRAKEMLDSGELGQVYQVRVTNSSRNGRTTHSWGWRADQHNMGGGELIDTGFHEVYLLMNLAGDEPVEVQVIPSNYNHPELLPTEDTAQLMMRFAHGVSGQVSTSWAWVTPEKSFHFEVIAEKGELRGSAAELQFRRTGQSTPITIELEPNDTFAAEILHFVESIATNQEPLQTAEDGAAVLRVIEAAYRAAYAGRVVRVEPKPDHADKLLVAA